MLVNATCTETRPDWPAIRADYLAGRGSFRELAAKHGCSFHTLAKRAKRERWTDHQATLGDAVTTAMATEAMKVATTEGRRIGLDAAGLVARTLSDTSAWLDRIEAVAARNTIDPQQLRHLVSSWRAVIETGRTALGLDKEEELGTFSITVMNTPINAIAVDANAARAELEAERASCALGPGVDGG